MKYTSKILTGRPGHVFTDEMRQNQLKTMLERYGVTNAYMLAKHRTKSKPQIAIYEWLLQQYPEFNFEIEKSVINEGITELFADIISFSHNIIIEFNGDFWHCNPSTYSKDFFHPVKKLTAAEIWSYDEKRQNFLQKAGFNVIIVWEAEYNSNCWKQQLIERIEKYGKKEDTTYKRPSVNNYSSADVKLGELLESHDTNATAQLETVNANAEKFVIKHDNQQPSSCLETVEKVQRLRLA